MAEEAVMAREDKTRPDTGVFGKDPAEGSREVIERELKRQGRDSKAEGRSAGSKDEAGEGKPEAGKAGDKTGVMDQTKGLP
jgi:hypothetical protein